MQDSQGFIWVGTTDGVFRFDGKQFIEFRHQKGDTTSISNNYVKRLFEDSKGNIWMATKSGLNCYSVENETFTRHWNKEGKVFEEINYIHYVMEDQYGKIWFGTYGGLFQLNPQSGEVLGFIPEKDNPFSPPSKVVWSIYEDKKGRLLIGTGKGLSVYKNDGSFRFENYLPEPETNGLKTGRIWRCAEQEDGTIWLGTDEGVYRILDEKEKLSFQRLEGKFSDDVGYPFIEDVIIGANNKLWTATWKSGLHEILLPQNEEEEIQVIQHRSADDNAFSLSANLVESVLEDNAGTIWAGTGNGLSKMANSAIKFASIQHIPTDLNSLSNNTAKSFLQDSYGNYWFGTRDGLNRLTKEKFDQKNFDFEIFKKEKNNPNSISNSNIFGLYEDNKGYLWIATYSGLNYIHLPTFDENQTFKSFGFKDGLPHSYIYNVLEINEEEYWVATYGQLSKMAFDPNNPAATRFHNYDMDNERTDALVNATTYQVCKDRNGDFWIGTFNGLSKYIEKDGQEFFENYLYDRMDSTSLSNNFITNLFLDSKGRMWVGTRSGLNLMHQTAKARATFQSFDGRHGLSNEVIQSMEEDEQGNFWIGTNRGLNVFNPTLALAGKNAVLSHYDFHDGLRGNLCMTRASLKDKEGNFFYGFGGINYFHPASLPKNRKAPKVVFTNLKLFNKVVRPDENGLLQKSITYTKDIVLNHRQNMLTIEFAALDFVKPEKNQFVYKMEGFKENWIEIGTENSATFTNLAPGDYIFKVKGSNNDGLWSNEFAELRIAVLPPPWNTWWAYILYVIAVGALVFVFIKYRINLKVKELEKKKAVELARMEEREELRKKNAADFHDDLGHSLTKISLFLELANRENSENSTLKQYLDKIKQNATTLSSGIRDLIWTLDPQKDSLYQTMIRLQEFGDQLFEYSDISFQTEGIRPMLEEVSLEPDVRKQVLMIFKEAMNNALKYSDATMVKLSLEQQNGYFNLAVKDNGIGFEKNAIATGYGMKNMQTRAKKIGSEIKIYSEPKKGTHIHLKKIPHVG